MTEENYNYRTSQKLLRNQFPGKGKLKIPIIPKFALSLAQPNNGSSSIGRNATSGTESL